MKGKRTDVWFRMQNLPKKTRSKLLLVAISLGIGCLLAFALAEFSCRLLGFGGGIVYESELYRTAAAPLAYELVPGYAGNSYRSKVTVSADPLYSTFASTKSPFPFIWHLQPSDGTGGSLKTGPTMSKICVPSAVTRLTN